MATSRITIRIDEDLRRQAEALFAELGYNMSTAFTAFAKQAVKEKKIPSAIVGIMPNQETMKAIEEIQMLKKEPDKTSYSGFPELLKDVQSEV